MPDPSVTHSSFAIERRYSASPARVFAAFRDKSEKRRWYAESKQMIAEEFEMDFRVGGSDVAAFRFGEKSPFPGLPLVYRTTYFDIVEDRRIVYAYNLSMGGKVISASLVTFEFLAAGDETEVLFTEQGAYFEGADGPAMRQQGWQGLLDRLGQHLAA